MWRTWVASTALALAFAGQAIAAEDDVEEVVVTAEKRSERLQDVPISMSVLSNEQIEKQRINTIDALTTVTPNLQRTTTVGENTPIFALRGVTMPDYSLNQEGPVALYYDEVYKGNLSLFGLGLFDVDRVEVLRGPQGTLYGKNTTAGAINIISRTPADFTTNGYATATVGNYNRLEGEAAFQTPLTDTVATRIAVTIARADGWLKNVYPGAEDLDGTRQWGIRSTTIWKPNDRFDFMLRGTITLQDPTNFGDTSITHPPYGVGGTDYAAAGIPTYFRNNLQSDQVDSDPMPRRRAATDALAGTANWRLSDGLKLTSISSWDYGSFFMVDDTDGSPLRVFRQVYYGNTKQIAQDLRLTSDFSGPLNFIVGAYYNQSQIYNYTDNQDELDVDVNGDGRVDSADCAASLAVGARSACHFAADFDQTKHSYAAYSDLRLKATDRITLRGGVRYTRDRGYIYNYRAFAFGDDGTVLANTIPGGADLNATTSSRFTNSNVSGKAGIDFKIADGQLLYVSYSTGYRGSAFNAQAFYSPKELNTATPEKVASIEGGFKGVFFDKRLQLNLAAFHYRYTDQQFLNFDFADGVTYLGNLPKVRVVGGEVELIARPVDRLTISGGLGILKSEVLEGSIYGVDLHGNQLFNAPKLTSNLVGDWDALRGSWGTLGVELSSNFTSKQYFDILNDEDAVQDKYVLFNGRVTLTSNKHWSVAAYSKNIANKYYSTSRYSYSASQGFAYTHRGEPRTFGLTFGYEF
jgi:iron complex outermembrane receptor protein